MKHLFLTLFASFISLMAAAQTTSAYKISNDALTQDELLAGGIQVALYVNCTTAQFYVSDGDNCAFSSDGATVFDVIKSGNGIKLRNVKSGEFFGGNNLLSRTTDEGAAKVFTPEKVTSKVTNTAAGADETRSYWLTFTTNSKYYLNTNTSNYKTVRYASGASGNWSVYYIYKVKLETTYATNIIPVPQKVTVNAKGCLKSWTKDGINYKTDATLGDEAYVLDIQATGITVTSSSDAGKYYALLSLDQLNEDADTLPLIKIEDSPRFSYRGFMLDVSRHFFTVEEVKRMIDVMARYKMNVFHWHLTDDQGWRAEINQYPLLTTTGAKRSDSYETPIRKVIQNDWTYWTGIGGMTGKAYGPYFYTQAEMKDVVAYAKERHINVLPEVDMPGHFVAAMAAYPQYSCTPNNPPSVWTSGGISSNVLNVGNDNAVQFAKNILGELCDIFPYEYIHIGGDECPTTQWQNNSECQALYSKEGFTNYRQLQTRFIKQISDFVATKGKKLVCWNESVTAGGADLDVMKTTGATIMSWNPCEGGVRKAISLGLPAIVTEYNRGNQSYYINRRQCTDFGEPSAAGDGDDSVEGCYSLVPMPSGLTTAEEALVRGVQGTFWTEHVGTPEYLEYLALPRLVCVAEAGWARQDQKDWKNFRARLLKHVPWFEENKYVYSNHWMPGYTPRVDTKKTVTPELSTVEKPKYYKIKFTNGQTYLQMNGVDNLATVENDTCDESQLFALVGTSTSNFKLYCAKGYWVGYKNATSTVGTTTDLLYGTTSKAKGTAFKIASFSGDNSKSVLTPTVSSKSSTSLNTWGGKGAGKNVGFYTSSDANCALIFQTDSEIPTAIQSLNAATSYPTSSTIYTLAGIPTERLQKGVNIVNGIKVMY